MKRQQNTGFSPPGLLDFLRTRDWEKFSLSAKMTLISQKDQEFIHA